MEKRDISAEIISAVDDFNQFRKGKLTLRTHKVEDAEPPELKPNEIIQIRQMLHMSRALFAKNLRIAPRSLERWEQGISKPNREAIILLCLVKKYPDTLKKIRSI